MTAAVTPTAVSAIPPPIGIDVAPSTIASTPTETSSTAAITISRASAAVDVDGPSSGSSESNASSAVSSSPAPTTGARWSSACVPISSQDAYWAPISASAQRKSRA